jgi:hypothetical protein
MRICSKLVLAALAATAVLALAVGAASATRLRVLNVERGFRAVWTPLTVTSNTGANVSCNVTIEGTFASSTYVKRAGTQLGSVTRVEGGPTCTGGSARALTETLPWSVTYTSFTGVLPAITGLTFNVIGVSAAIAPQEASFACLLRTTTTNPASGIANLSEAGGGLRRIDTIRADETKQIPLSGGPFGVCGLSSASVANTGTASVLGETAKTIVVLI